MFWPAAATRRTRPIPRVLIAFLALVALGGMLLVLSSGPADAQTTFTVNKTGDAGDLTIDGVCDASGRSGDQCTLRAAIQEANDPTENPGLDTINFKIGGKATVKTIKVGSTGLGDLPAITEAITINGYTQRRAKANTLAEGNDAVLKVVLNGANAGAGASGLEISASNSTIKGLVINRFRFGVVISGSGATTGNNVEGNFIGTNAKGTTDLGNAEAGVLISGSENNTIGGTDPAQRNLISGNDASSLGLASVEIFSDENNVEGNFIGTNAKGTTDLGNADGVGISGNNNTVGGTTSGARNVISGNTDDGVFISGAVGNNVEGNFIGTNAKGIEALGNGGDGVHILGVGNTVGETANGARNVISGNLNGVFLDAGAEGNQVLGNFIGTDENGTAALANGGDGVRIFDAPDNTIGGTAAGAGNTISGNSARGVLIVGGEATGNQVMGNRIGTKADGTGDLGNDADGVTIASAPNNTIGGTASGAGNVISGNGDDGVNIVNSNNFTSTATGNSVLSNSIFSNTGLGIDLGTIGVTLNDTDDPDTGPNNLQNFPVITSAIRDSTTGTTSITGTLNSNPNASFLIECFETDGASATSHGEGERFLDFDVVSTNAGGDSGPFFCDGTGLEAGDTVSATATKTNGPDTLDTSEFSENELVVQQ